MAIVVGVDGSPESLQALRWALAEAKLRKTTVRAVHAWQYPRTMVISDPFLGGPEVDPLLIEPSELEGAVEGRLAELVRGVASEPDAVEQRVVQGNPAESLVEASKDAELLVVGSRGRGGFSGLLLGSVSQACAHHAHCPVVIVRSPSKKDER